MAFKGFDARASRLILSAAIGDEFTVTAIAHAGLARAIPQVSTGRRGDRKDSFAGIREFARLVMSIIHGPHLFDEIRRIRGHTPFVAVRADLALDIEIVEQNEVSSELMKIRGNPLREQAKFGVPIPLGHIAEDLVVGPVFLDDIQAVLDWRMAADRDRDRAIGGRHGRHTGIRPQRAALISLARPS